MKKSSGINSCGELTPEGKKIDISLMTDKARFLEIAHIYYALAIAAVVRKKRSSVSQDEILEDYTYYSEFETITYLPNGVLFTKAIDWLEQYGIVEVLQDDFGPALFDPTPNIVANFDLAASQKGWPFYKYNSLKTPRSWLEKALTEVNQAAEKLQITSADYDNSDHLWQPLPIDRAEPDVKAMITSIDELVEQVRSNNGYSATVPEERNYVLDNLDAASRTLKEADSTTVPFLRKAVFEPVVMLLKRFRDNAISVTATAVREAAVDFIKSHASHLITWVSHFL